MSDAYNVYSTLLIFIAFCISCGWAWIALRSPKFFKASHSFIFANGTLSLSAVALAFLPSLLYSEFHGYNQTLGYAPIVSNFLTLVSASFYRFGKLNLIQPKISKMDMAEIISIPFLFAIVDCILVSHGLDTVMNFEITFGSCFSYVIIRVIADIYDCNTTIVVEKFVQSMPFKLLAIVQITHMAALISNGGYVQGRDESNLMLGYILLLVLVNASIAYQVHRLVHPVRIGNRFKHGSKLHGQP